MGKPRGDTAIVTLFSATHNDGPRGLAKDRPVAEGVIIHELFLFYIEFIRPYYGLTIVRGAGVEPATPVWKTEVLPLN